jgi:cellulose synthase/poly-beta-1,6-N-acetylglucosamine synthase-like glycosyltransferase
VTSQVLAGLGVLLFSVGAFLRLESRHRRERVESERARRAAGAPTGRLDESINMLRRTQPDLVADTTFTSRQLQVLLALGAVVALCLDLSVHLTVMVLVGGAIVLYLVSLIVRLRLFRLGLNQEGLIRIDDETARHYPAELLPTYTVLVPAYGEPEVFGRLVGNLRAIDYPRHKLEIMLLLEADDEETIAAAREAVLGSTDFTIVLVPPAEPRTKPKALNYGLIEARGEIVSVYDAEDRPDVLQLRKAAMALAAAPPDVACVQARLAFFNPQQNLLTRWFTLDYRMWFGELLPGLVRLNAPIPLGGTSNHFRRSALLDAGAWDAYNVTEDADLGIRLYRLGYRTGVIDSVTLEEANSDLVNWVKQRSRWYKGYAQTLLVHLRHPREFKQQIGLRPLLLTCLFIGGTPLLAAINSFFWACVIVWFIFQPHFFREVLPTLTYFLGMISWIAGNAFILYSWLLSARRTEDRLVIAAILSPLYWIMMAMAATKAMIQLITAPSYWEKTQHGLDVDDAEAAESGVKAA